MTTANWNIIYSGGDPLANSHALIIGGSGSGKTYLIKHILIPSIIEQGANVLVFDYNGDFGDEDYLQSLGQNKVRHIRTHLESLGFNPFVIPTTGETQRLAGACIHLANLFAKVFRLGEQQRASLAKILESQYRQVGISDMFADSDLASQRIWPTFRSVITALQDENGLAANRLQDLASLDIFTSDASSFSDLLQRSCVIALKDLAGEYTKEAVAELVMRAVYYKLLREGKREGTNLFLVVDEAHKIANLPAASVLLREARKFGCGVILSSQRPRDFKEDILANVATRFVFKVNMRDDAVYVAKQLLSDSGSADVNSIVGEIMRLRVGECVMSNSQVHSRKVKVGNRSL